MRIVKQPDIVELEDWEAAWLWFIDEWKPEQIDALKRGVSSAVQNAERLTQAEYLSHEDHLQRDAFRAGWEAATKSFCESEGLPYKEDAPNVQAANQNR